MDNRVKGALLYLTFCLLSRPASTMPQIDGFTTDQIRVTVHGQLDNPGVFTLPADSRLADLLPQLQLQPAADLDGLNEAMVLKDNDVIVIPEHRSAVLQVSVNQGTAEQLDLVPGIGPATARAIIEYRQVHGFFQSLDQLTAVQGIGARTLVKIRPYLTL
jgi:competence protein ComEA